MMNATQNLLILMQQMAGNMTLPQTGGKNEKSGVSFEDLLNQAGSKTAPKDKAPVKDDGKPQGAAKTETAETPKAQTQENTEEPQTEEEKTAYQILGSLVNPYANLVQPDIQPAEETEVLPETVQTVTAAVVPMAEEAVPTETVQPQTQTGETPFENTQKQDVPEDPQLTQNAPETIRQSAGKTETETEPAELEARTEKLPQREAVQGDRRDEEDTAPVTDSESAQSPEQPLFRETEAAPVKVGERYEVHTETEDMDTQMAATLRQAVTAGLDKVEIRLTPEHLGALTVEMTRDAGGALQIVLHTANSKAAGLLTQHLDSLHAALQNMGHDTVQVEVQRSEENAQQHNLHQQANPDGHNPNRQPQQQRRQQSANPQDFLQQLRLGLFSLEDVI